MKNNKIQANELNIKFMPSRKMKTSVLMIANVLAGCIFTNYVYAADAFSYSQQELQLQKNREIKNNLDEQLRTKPSVVEKPAPPVAPVSSANSSSFMIDRIELDDGGKAIELGTKELFAKYEHKRLDNQAIFVLLRELTNRIYQRGYVTTTIVPVAHNLNDGVLKLRIEWGRVAGWLIDGRAPSNGKERRMVAAAMPGVVGKPLNIHDIDQAVENLNNNAKFAQISIVPAPETGFSLLNLNIQPSTNKTVTLGLNNSGPGSTADGRYQATLNAFVSDILGWNDTFGVGLNRRFYPGTTGNAQLGYNLSYQQPIGYVTISSSYNHLGYDKQINGLYGNYGSNGISDEGILKISTVVNRNQAGKLTIYGGLDYKRAKNYIEGYLLTVNSKPYTNLMFGASWLKTQAYGGVLYSDLTWNYGIPWLGGAAGAIDSSGHNKDASFFNGNLSWSRDFLLLQNKFNYVLRVGAQYSPMSLASVYQMQQGDEYTVRGFKGDPLYGDQGAYLSQTINLPTFSLGRSLASISPFVGVDYGWAKNVQTNEIGIISGVAVGMRAQWRQADLSLTLARPLHALPGASSQNVLYLGLSAGI